MKWWILALCLFNASCAMTKSGRCGTSRREMHFQNEEVTPGQRFECSEAELWNSGPERVVRPRVEKPNQEGAEFIAGVLGLISPANKSSRSCYEQRSREFRGGW